MQSSVGSQTVYLVPSSCVGSIRECVLCMPLCMALFVEAQISKGSQVCPLSGAPTLGLFYVIIWWSKKIIQREVV